MKRIVIVFLLHLLVCSFVVAQDNSKPFDALDKQVREQSGGWNGSKENLSKVFNNERNQLGDRFESELWKYLGNNVERHYWIASFLEAESYLHGNTPLPELALTVRQKGIELVENKNDDKSLGTRYKFSILAAVASEKLGKREQALGYKKQAETLINGKPDLSFYTPALNEYERCIYQNIGYNTSQCQKTNTKNTPITQINGGIVNGKAVSLPRPEYPKAARKNKAEGAVRVKVVIDENGNVISAAALDGHPDLHEAAVEAARQAKFTPTKLSGQPVKVTGVVIYNFVR